MQDYDQHSLMPTTLHRVIGGYSFPDHFAWPTYIAQSGTSQSLHNFPQWMFRNMVMSIHTPISQPYLHDLFDAMLEFWWAIGRHFAKGMQVSESRETVTFP